METGQTFHYFDESFVDVSNQQYPLTADYIFYIIATKQTH